MNKDVLVALIQKDIADLQSLLPALLDMEQVPDKYMNILLEKAAQIQENTKMLAPDFSYEDREAEQRKLNEAMRSIINDYIEHKAANQATIEEQAAKFALREAELQKEIENSTCRCTQTLELLGEAQSKITSFEALVAEKQQLIEQLERKVQENEARSTQNDASRINQIERQESEIANLKSNLAEMANAHGAVEMQYANAIKAVNEANKRIKELEQQLASKAAQPSETVVIEPVVIEPTEIIEQHTIEVAPAPVREEPKLEAVHPAVVVEPTVKEPVAAEPVVIVEQEEPKATTHVAPNVHAAGHSTEANQAVIPEAAVTTVADKMERHTTVFDSVGTTAPTLAAQLNEQKIDDISQAISIADRFLYIRELFAGNAEKYGQAISKFNSFDSLEQAEQYIAKNLDWNTDSPTVEKFINLLHRRYL